MKPFNPINVSCFFAAASIAVSLVALPAAARSASSAAYGSESYNDGDAARRVEAIAPFKRIAPDDRSRTQK